MKNLNDFVFILTLGINFGRNILRSARVKVKAYVMIYIMCEDIALQNLNLRRMIQTRMNANLHLLISQT